MANFEGRDTKIGGNVGPIFAKRRAKGFFKIPKGNFFKAIYCNHGNSGFWNFTLKKLPGFHGFSKLAKNLYDCSSIHCELFGTRFCGSTVPRKCSNRLLKNPAPIVATKCPKMAKNGTHDGQIPSGLLLFDFSPSKTWEWTPIKMYFEKIDFFVFLWDFCT